MRTFATCLLTLLLPATACAQSAVTPRPLNDTGILFCGDATNGNAACTTTPGPAGQDALYGRDAAAAAGALFRQGSSAVTVNPIGGSGVAGQTNSFDYTKIANNGNELDASVALGPNPTDWACTRDNVTGLMWEVKTDDNGLRDKDHTHVNNTNTSASITAGNTCSGTLTDCNTENYVDAVNVAGLCGHNDWRMPTIKELESIVDFGRASPAIDPDYFPNTPPSNYFWSGSPYVGDANRAWSVTISSGIASVATNRGNSNQYRVRLVRAGQ